MKTTPKRPTGDDRRPWPEGTHYRFRKGVHELILSRRRVSARMADEAERGGVEFALVDGGTWIVMGYRIGRTAAWSFSSPFNWHTMPEDDRLEPPGVGPAAVDDPRLWSTLWVILEEAGSGLVHVRRPVALCPEFARALHRAIRLQAREPFAGAAADHDLSWLNRLEGSPIGRAVVRARCGPSFPPDAGRPGRPTLGASGSTTGRGADRRHATGPP